MILIIGSNGQVGREIKKLPGTFSLSRNDLDLFDTDSIKKVIKEIRPSIVINTAAYTNVEKAEKDQHNAFLINCEAPKIMAETCELLETPFIHLSTEYVFSGDGMNPWKPEDKPAPINVYGRSKWFGEKAVLSSCSKALVLRTSWIFSAFGTNFVKTMIKLSKVKNRIKVVDDQIGNPSSAHSISNACYKIALDLINGKGQFGIFHYSGYPTVSWADFAKEIFKNIKTDIFVDRIKSEEFSSFVKRPLNSKLDCRKLQSVFNIKPDSWKKDLIFVLDELGE